MGGYEQGLFSGFYFPDIFFSFYALFLEATPFLLLGAIFGGLVDLALPTQRLRQWLPRLGRFRFLASIGAGVLLPLCECSSIAVTGRLIRKGMPLSLATTYLLASPLFNPLTILSTYLAFRNQNPWSMVFLRLGFGGIIVMGLGLWIERQKSEQILRPEVLLHPVDAVSFDDRDLELDPRAPFPSIQRFCALVIRDFLSVMPFLILGAFCAAIFGTSINRNYFSFSQGSFLIWPFVGILLSQILCLCSTVDAFVIAAFGNFPVAAKLAFLIAGPLFDFKLYWLYQSLFKRGFVQKLWWRALISTLILTLGYGFFNHA